MPFETRKESVYATPDTGLGIPAVSASYSLNGGDVATSNNGMGGARPYKKAGDGAVSLSAINNPSTTISVCNLVGEEWDPKVDNSGYLTNPIKTFQSHLGVTNILFMDGHVKALKPTVTATSAINMWTNDNTGTHAILQGNLATAEGLLK